MITKAVTQDIYGNTRTYIFPTRTYSEKISSKCSKCGKKIEKSISIQYQDKPSKEDYARLEERKQAWLSEEHICNKCLKQTCKGEQRPIDTAELESCIAVIKDREEQINVLRKERNIHSKFLQDKLKDKVCLFEGKEYLLEYVSHSDGYYDGYYIYGHKIDERNPWTTTNKEIYVSETGNGFGCGSVNAAFKNITFTDEVFSDRRKRLKEFEVKENG